MIWRILGTIGAASFFVTGFSVIGDSNCVSADISGARVVGVTCRADGYGTMSGASAGFLMLAIGTALLFFIYWRYIQRYIFGTHKKELIISRDYPILSTPTAKAKEMAPDAEYVQVKICEKCGAEVQIFSSKCLQCEGTSFTHKQVEKAIEIRYPDFKTCPMCAEEIRFAAKKCRYCQNLLDF